MLTYRKVLNEVRPYTAPAPIYMVVENPEIAKNERLHLLYRRLIEMEDTPSSTDTVALQESKTPSVVSRAGIQPLKPKSSNRSLKSAIKPKGKLYELYEEYQDMAGIVLGHGKPRKITQDEMKDREAMRMHIKARLSNYIGQFPTSSVNLRWQARLADSDYSIDDIACLAAQDGPFRQLRIISRNSALLVHDSLSQSCRVISRRSYGHPDNPIHREWRTRDMRNKVVRMSRKGVKVDLDSYSMA